MENSKAWVSRELDSRLKQPKRRTKKTSSRQLVHLKKLVAKK